MHTFAVSTGLEKLLLSSCRRKLAGQHLLGHVSPIFQSSTNQMQSRPPSFQSEVIIFEEILVVICSTNIRSCAAGKYLIKEEDEIHFMYTTT